MCIELVTDILLVPLQVSLSVIVLLFHFGFNFIKFTVYVLLLHVEIGARACKRHGLMAVHLVMSFQVAHAAIFLVGVFELILPLFLSLKLQVLTNSISFTYFDLFLLSGFLLFDTF